MTALAPALPRSPIVVESDRISRDAALPDRLRDRRSSGGDHRYGSRLEQPSDDRTRGRPRLPLRLLVHDGAIAQVRPCARCRTAPRVRVRQPVDRGHGDRRQRGDSRDPGGDGRGLASPLFWGSLAFALAVAFVVAYPLNRYLIARGQGHAVVHGHHSSSTAGAPERTPPGATFGFIAIGVIAIAVTIAVTVGAAVLLEG